MLRATGVDQMMAALMDYTTTHQVANRMATVLTQYWDIHIRFWEAVHTTFWPAFRYEGQFESRKLCKVNSQGFQNHKGPDKQTRLKNKDAAAQWSSHHHRPLRYRTTRRKTVDVVEKTWKRITSPI